MKKLVVTLVDDSTIDINIDMLPAVFNIPIGAPPDHEIYIKFALDTAAGFIDPRTKGTPHPEVISASQIKRVKIDLGRNLSYEQEFLSKK